MMEFGTHCEYSYCKQKDFLPFKCTLCSKNHCLEHRSSQAHECEKQVIQYKAIVCPVCNKTVKYNSGLSENEAWEIHSATECDESMYQPQAWKNERCSVNKCGTELKEINTYTCKICTKKVCMKHRLPEEHQCMQDIPQKKNLHNNPSLNNNPLNTHKGGTYNFQNAYNNQYLQNQWGK